MTRYIMSKLTLNLISPCKLGHVKVVMSMSFKIGSSLTGGGGGGQVPKQLDINFYNDIGLNTTRKNVKIVKFLNP